AEEVTPSVLADFVNGDNVGVVQTRHGARFALETLRCALGCNMSGQDHLDRDKSIQADLPGAVDNAHAPSTNLCNEFIVANAPRKIGTTRFNSRKRARLSSRLMHAVVVCEERFQVRGQTGMPGQQVGAVGAMAALDRVQEVSD